MGNNLFGRSLWASVLVISVVAFGAAGCGGTDAKTSSGSKVIVEEPSDTDSGTTESGPVESATFEDALACLQAAGIDAKDQSSNTGGEVIGIDYSGGRTTISFEESVEDADTTASIAESYGEVVQVGSVVASIDPSADSADTEIIKTCIAA